MENGTSLSRRGSSPERNASIEGSSTTNSTCSTLTVSPSCPWARLRSPAGHRPQTVPPTISVLRRACLDKLRHPLDISDAHGLRVALFIAIEHSHFLRPQG